MTAAELQNCRSLPPKSAYMACHFSSYGSGISNAPSALPAGSMLILNDRIPICGHDPELVASQLEMLTQENKCRYVLLDLQRPFDPQALAVCRCCLEQISCPVGISHLYAGEFSCPVFLPPVPPDQPLEQHLAPWKGRELWLEIATDSSQLTLTADGCQVQDALPRLSADGCFCDDALLCQYRQRTETDRITVDLWRSPQQIAELIHRAKEHGVQVFAGLYQQLKGFIS